MTKPKTVKFDELGLSDKVLEAINRKGFEEATEIQALAIPLMLRDDTNIIAQAQTGTGKTAAFGLPLLEMINTSVKQVQALILVPTRELAIQVAEEINSLKGSAALSVIPVYGGQSITEQLRRLRKGVHIVVGTPGRVIDHLNRKTLKIEKIEHLILDEADEMLNMGFVDDIEEIMAHTNEDKRTLLFSATLPERIKKLARKYMDDYELITVKKSQLTTNLTEQIYFEVKNSEKFEALCRIIDFEEGFYGLVFCRTKNDVDSVATHLNDRSYDAVAIHGDIAQAAREKTLQKFKKKKCNILIATDVAARGIDVSDLTHVINYALPQDPESYVHRIGRTGRAGKEGTAITFISPSEYKRLMFIQKIARIEIKKSKVPNVKDIINVKKKRISSELAEVQKEEISKSYATWANELLEESTPEEALSSVLSYCFGDELDPKSYKEIRETSSKDRGRSDLNLEGKTRLFVAKGRKDKITPRKLMDLIMERVTVKSKDIKDMQIMDNFSFINVPFDKAEEIVKSFKTRGERPIITHANAKKRR